MDRNMLTPSKWKRLLKNKFIYVNVSAYDKKTVYGFSVKRVNNWKSNLDDWEISLIEYLCDARMKKIGYKVYKKNPNLYKKGLRIMNRDTLLKKRLRHLGLDPSGKLFFDKENNFYITSDNDGLYKVNFNKFR